MDALVGLVVGFSYHHGADGGGAEVVHAVVGFDLALVDLVDLFGRHLSYLVDVHLRKTLLVILSHLDVPIRLRLLHELLRRTIRCCIQSGHHRLAQVLLQGRVLIEHPLGVSVHGLVDLGLD